MTSDDVMDCVPHQAGDALWVPTWTWHRVDYIEGVTALAASLFHVRCEQIATHPPGMQVLTTAPATLPSLRTQVRRVGTLMASEITLRLLQPHNMEICCLAPPRALQVRREQIVTHNPLFAAVVFPNMVKELVGWKKQ